MDTIKIATIIRDLLDKNDTNNNLVSIISNTEIVFNDVNDPIIIVEFIDGNVFEVSVKRCNTKF